MLRWGHLTDYKILSKLCLTMLFKHMINLEGHGIEKHQSELILPLVWIYLLDQGSSLPQLRKNT